MPATEENTKPKKGGKFSAKAPKAGKGGPANFQSVGAIGPPVGPDLSLPKTCKVVFLHAIYVSSLTCSREI